MMLSMILKYFKGSIIFSVLGLLASAGVGYYYNHSFSAATQALFIAMILAVLEVSLSFDNAIVNATVLKDMTPLWRHRFLTWGILIAVFGMRLLFPILIVCFFVEISPWAALDLALMRPDDYAKVMLGVHPFVAAFGGMFLLMVALKYFFDGEKDEHWLSWLEAPLSNLGKLQVLEVTLALSILVFITKSLDGALQLSFLLSGIGGLITYLIVDGLGAYLESSGKSRHTGGQIERASAGMFIYLEVLDASFSFDGVVGAFAITSNLLIIVLGLGIGAFFVRSLTILFVEKETLLTFRYLEHGAFYAIFLLAVMMLLDPILHIPEWVTGLSGAVVIGLALYSSIKDLRSIKN